MKLKPICSQIFLTNEITSAYCYIFNVRRGLNSAKRHILSVVTCVEKMDGIILTLFHSHDLELMNATIAL